MFTTEQEIRDTIDQIQIWFASKPYGWRERATPQMLQQFADREREQDYLIDCLERMRENQS